MVISGPSNREASVSHSGLVSVRCVRAVEVALQPLHFGLPSPAT